MYQSRKMVSSLQTPAVGIWKAPQTLQEPFAFWKCSTEYERRLLLPFFLCNLHLANVVFPYGTTGGSLDVIGRLPLWKRGLDFNHGTGHGVGYLMNIHEEPARFRRYLGNKAPIQDIALEPGMIITDEPGVYIAGSHGIRTENELMICEGETTTYGRFLYFKPITLVPIDLDAVVPEMMTIEDKELLNAYHKRVYETLAPHMKEDERKWLAEYTRAI